MNSMTDADKLTKQRYGRKKFIYVDGVDLQESCAIAKMSARCAL